MAVYLSPGIFTNEVDVSALPIGVGPLRPAFIGTANKGPLNEPVLITSSADYIDKFGSPFQLSYLGYAVLGYLEEGNQCYVMRVGVEAQAGQPTQLSSIAIDTSGARSQGWGRIPVFTGVDKGRINLRAVTVDNPLKFHTASSGTVTYNESNVGSTYGPTAATMTLSGSYTGVIEDNIILIITNGPTNYNKINGATYSAIRESDGQQIAVGTLTDTNNTGTSLSINFGNGVTGIINVTNGVLGTNDTFTFNVLSDNRSFAVSVENGTATTRQMPAATYTSVSSFVAAFNALLTSEQYVMSTTTLANGTVVPQLVTNVAGKMIQITGSKAFALQVGTQQYTWDIPRSYLIGLDSGPYNITSSNNKVVIDAIGSSNTVSTQFSIPVGLNQTAASIVNTINLANTTNGVKYFQAIALTIPDGTQHVVITTSLANTTVDRSLDLLSLRSDYSNIKTLRFAEELQIQTTKRGYRGFTDSRLTLPASGQYNVSLPYSCELNSVSADCVNDQAYYNSIVGYFVAASPGTWVNGYKVTVKQSSSVVGDAAGRYDVLVYNAQGQLVENAQNVSFDQRDARYIGNVVNPGTSIGGPNGNPVFNWEPRPSFLNYDPNTTDPSNPYVVRQPSPFANMTFGGMANGIPVDPAYSSALDAAVIGNPSNNSGIFGFQNQESIDINLLAIPGFATGAVIGQALAMCENRGDVLFLVDPPFGLRPQQVVDWHNGMLTSSLSAAINSSYGSLYYSWIKIYDQFSNSYMWVPPSGHISAVFSRTARVAEQWFAPAGIQRGKLLTALDVEYSPSQGERDLLYGSGNAVNSIVKFPQDGIVVFGQRTLQRQATVLDRVNVRMLLNYLKKTLSKSLRGYTFEPNDTILWRQVTSTLEPILGDVQGRRGISAFKVVCNETNNTDDRKARNELWVSVFIKPTPTAEFIALNLVTLRTDSSFSATEVLAAGGIITTA